jgi:hypothetical protein
LIWNLSRKRLIILKITEFRPSHMPVKAFSEISQVKLLDHVKSQQHEYRRMSEPFLYKGLDGILRFHFACTEFQLFHKKFEGVDEVD